MMEVQSEGSSAIPAIAAIPLPNAGLAALVFEWDLTPILSRTAARMGWDAAYAAEVAQEYRRFLYVSVAHPGERLGMAGPVDEAWHDHILDSMDYVEFCRLASGRYLHHTPQNESGSEGGAEYARTLALIEAEFGEINRNVWPRTDETETQCCSNCSHVTDRGGALLLS